ncbi:MAG: hypothetical protein BWK80_32765 [Desulfobacteraceae bacterium IS3]|jgi:putative addiction module component (TIGR02574 family)|nr:MAG: hypothetical protein BWK80_32765 [Desulfobacteraceae bacterium IS3]HAO20349.1 hypothetical protein [Desulfobacteraceae bacterium]
MQYVTSKNDIVKEVRKLNIIERLTFITDIWDEIKEARELEFVSEEDKKLLLDRLTDYRLNPSSATDWTELKKEVYRQYDKQH